jgi:hypothetical protein
MNLATIKNIATLEETRPTEPGRVRGKRTLEHGVARPLAKLVPDRRRYRRVPIRVFGRFMREDEQEYPCQIINMSAGGVALLAPVECREAERIVAYLDNFGRIEGVVARTFEGGFALRIIASRDRREKIANRLTWLINRESLGLTEERGHERAAPRNPLAKLILPNGEVQNCRIIDVSVSGASIAIDVKPPIGTVVLLARIRGEIVRHHEKGVAIKFASLQDPDSLARSFS